MVLLLFTIAILLLQVRSIFLLVFRFKSGKRFAFIHFLIFTVTGLVSFGLLFLMAMASMAHYVPSDFEQAVDDIVLYMSFFGVGIPFAGCLVLIVRTLKPLFQKKRLETKVVD
jgi:hypothetical protein